MIDKLSEIEKSALDKLQSVDNESSLDVWRVTHLGRSSALMEVLPADCGALSKEERPTVGQAANRVKVALEAALADKTRIHQTVRAGTFAE